MYDKDQEGRKPRGLKSKYMQSALREVSCFICLACFCVPYSDIITVTLTLPLAFLHLFFRIMPVLLENTGVILVLFTYYYIIYII